MERYATRKLDGVGTPESVQEAIAAVEDTFALAWLKQEGRARLQRVWKRFDHLANLELYTLGKGILSVRSQGHEEWLKKTVHAIRKSPTSHGLVTEIITHAMLRLGETPFTPAPPNAPAYDFHATSSAGDQYLLSIKNHDVTDGAKEFARLSGWLRKAWRSRLILAKRNLSLNVWSSQPMTSADFEAVVGHIKGPDALSERTTELAPHLNVRAAALGYGIGELSPAPISDSVLVVAPAGAKEQTRFVKNLRSAAERFGQVPHESKQWRVLHMRVHAMADIDYLQKLATAVLEKPEADIDVICLHQPSYSRDANNASLIHHAYKLAATPRFAMERADKILLKVAPPVGSVSTSSTPIILMQNGVQHAALPPNTYLYQQGDVYRALHSNNGSWSGALGSPASGIREHLVMRSEIVGAKGAPSMIFSPKETPESDKLLLV